jgi:hypothetical protein
MSGEAEPADRILIVGDSQAQGLAAGLQRQYRGDHTCRVIDRSRIATGLVSATRFDWPAEAATIAEAERGAITLVMFGANDRPPIKIKGQPDPGFVGVYETHVQAVAKGLKRFSRAVIWVGHPIVRDPAYAEDIEFLNRIYAVQAIDAGIDWFPSWPLFTDSAGGYDAFGKGLDGPTVRLRADDGVHFTAAGYDVLAHALVPVIGLYRPFRVHS